jgi:probable rRNA maturation factor
MHKINIYNNQKTVLVRINRAKLKGVLKYILKQERQPGGVFNFVFVDNREIRRINRQYLGRTNVTDVIAFPLLDRKGMPTDNIRGEVVISVAEALRQSRQRGIPLNKEIALYCIHGLLHLSGYDDLTKIKRLKMEQKQLDYLALV